MSRRSRIRSHAQISGSAGALACAPSSDLSDAMIQAYVNVKGPYRINPHCHPHFELLYILRGVRRCYIEKKAWTARSGDLLVFRPGEVHQEFAGSKMISFIVLRFHPNQLASTGIQFPPTDQLDSVLRLPHREGFVELFTRLLEEKNHPREGSSALLRAYLVEFVVLLRRAVAESTGWGVDADAEGRKRIQTAIKIIQDNLTVPLRLQDLARKVYLSASRFSHVFKADVGESPRSFAIKERIERARELLAVTHQPAQEIAELLGYKTPYFFYRQFKEKTGQTAVEYRQAARQKAKKCISKS